MTTTLGLSKTPEEQSLRQAGVQFITSLRRVKRQTGLKSSFVISVTNCCTLGIRAVREGHKETTQSLLKLLSGYDRYWPSTASTANK